MFQLKSKLKKNVLVNKMVIKEKAKILFEDLKCNDGESSTMETFGVSNRCFSHFKIP